MSLPNSGNPSPMETMAKERVNIPFDIRKMGVILHGSEESLALKERFMLEMSRDPVMQLRDVHDLSKDELRERTMEKIAEMRHYVKTEDSKTFARRCQTVGLSDAGFQTRFGVSTGLFLGAIRNGSTKEQWDYWVDKGVLQMPERIIGCFGMTELEHGSNVAGLLTTATLDKKTDEFIIHTPNLGATKWWIGGAAQSATHCSVFAQLMVDGKRYGTKTFIVPIRDPKTFKTLPGILIGDIGRKMGRDGVDNGYLQFSYVRVPRDYMMMKYTQVSKSGEVTDTAAPQMAYGALISGRVGMVTDSAVIAKKGLTIAIRYGIVRRQFSAGSDDVETQILDYPIHQRRLMPLMAQAIAIGFASMTLQKKYEDVMESRSHLGPSQLDPANHAAEIKELHVMAAGLKAFSTWACLDMLEKSRQTCGGHGYSAYSTFPQLISDFAVQCTWEGDNTVLMLQSGRALVSYLEDVKKGKKVPDGVAYLKTASSSSGSKSDGSLSLKDIERGFEKVTCGAVEDAYAEYSSFLKKGQNKEKALESCSNLRFVAARLHSITWLFKNFVTALDKTPAGPERKVLEQVCRLYGLWQVELEAAQFLSSGYFGKEHLAKIQTEINDLCLIMRKCAIPLTDAFFNTDFILNSPLGRYDGDVYNAYFDTVRRANPPGPHPYFDRVIKPLLEAPPVNLKGKL